MISKHNNLLKPGLTELYKKMTKGRGRRKMGKSVGKDRMIKLNTEVVPDNLDVEKLADYINIADTTLNVNKIAPLNLVFGKCINLKRAMDYAVYPKMKEEHLMKPNLRGSVINKIVTKTLTLPNYWAYLGYLAIERILQDEELLELLKTNKPIINARVSTVKSFKGLSTTVVPNSAEAMYTGIIRAVVDVIVTTPNADDLKDNLDKLIQDLKKDKSKSVFVGMEIKTSYL